MSLAGTVSLLIYSLHKADSVFIFAYLFTPIPYIRNLMIHRQNKAALQPCAGCGHKNSPEANYCPHCGEKLG